jgi:hypothetical protein
MTTTPGPFGVEWELSPGGTKRTGRWRRRQYYARMGDITVPSKRVPCEWRVGKPK